MIHQKCERMADTMVRLMGSMPAEGKQEIDIVKQREFDDKPYAESYRRVICLGPDKMRETEVREKRCKRASENIRSATGEENPFNHANTR